MFSQPIGLIYKNETGGIRQYNNMSVPWSYSYKALGGTYIFVAAESRSFGATLNVNIYKNGKLFVAESDTGDYVLVTAVGTI